MRTLTLPLTLEDARTLRAGEEILLNGVLWTARDAAHKQLINTLHNGGVLPLDLRGETLYFVGPSPARPGNAIGAAGPTTSGRMDPFSVILLEETGLRGMIGKGDRSQAVIEAMKKQGAVYFAAIGGAGALLAQRIVKCEVFCYPELGTEAIHRLEVCDFPVIVAIDSQGNSLYALEAKESVL